jgi:AcrR family transcriptional regulator
MVGHRGPTDGYEAASSATRERILVAAAKTLSLKGYSETRLVDIAELADLRAPALYYYFDSREELIAEVMSVGQQRLREHVETALGRLPTELSPLERIGAAVRAHLEVELELSEFATAVTRNLGQLPDDLRSRLRAEGGAYMALWRQLLEVAQESGAIRADIDLGVARMLIIGALNWTLEWWDPEQGPIVGLVETAVRLVRHALGSQTPAAVPSF